MTKRKSAGSKTPSSIIEFEVAGSGGTLKPAGFKEAETRAEFYDDLVDQWERSSPDLAYAMDELQPLAWAVQSIYSDIRDDLEARIDNASEENKPDSKKIAQLKVRLASMPEEPEEGVADWLRTIDGEYFASYVVPRIRQWFSDPPNRNFEDDYLPESATGQGWALDYFRNMDRDSLKLIGVVIVEGDLPGSTYYAAELRGGIEKANKAAKRSGLNVRFVVAKGLSDEPYRLTTKTQ